MATQQMCYVCKKPLSDSPQIDIKYACHDGIPRYYRIFPYGDTKKSVCPSSGVMIEFDENYNELCDEGIGIVHFKCVADLVVTSPVILNPFAYNLATTACGEHRDDDMPTFKPSDSWEVRLSGEMDERDLIYDKERCWACWAPTTILVLPK